MIFETWLNELPRQPLQHRGTEETEVFMVVTLGQAYRERFRGITRRQSGARKIVGITSLFLKIFRGKFDSALQPEKTSVSSVPLCCKGCRGNSICKGFWLRL